MTTRTLSVVIPAYNAEASIGATLRALHRALETHSRFAAHNQQINRIRRTKPNGGIKTPSRQ